MVLLFYWRGSLELYTLPLSTRDISIACCESGNGKNIHEFKAERMIKPSLRPWACTSQTNHQSKLQMCKKEFRV
jgi:hypothetical protein